MKMMMNKLHSCEPYPCVAYAWILGNVLATIVVLLL